MLEVIAKFIRLEELEETLVERQSAIDVAPERLAALEEPKNALTKELLETKARLLANTLLLKSLETDLLKLKELKDGNSVRLTRATTDKTYKAILKEGDTIKEKTKEKEDNSLELMSLNDAMNATLPDLEAKLAEATFLFEREKFKV
ncbi:MAG: hypothetical protein LBF41_00015, partial [Deltaproteobacteria bacterium]|nr:hypothetical protein [Deltaproteobacteria bacterium]